MQEIEMEEERDELADEQERETKHAAMCRQTGYAFMDENRQRTDAMFRCDN